MSGVRGRTRQAILDAAVTLLSKDPGASLGEIAVAAGVGRTTVHRYFPERADLMRAIGTDALERIAVATSRARLTEGTALEALERLCQEFFELGDVLMLLFSDVTLMTSPEWEEETPSDQALLELVARGHREGLIDPEFPGPWVQQLLWSFLYSAWDLVRSYGASKHDALRLCLRSLRKSLTA